MSAPRFDWRGVLSRALFCLFTVFALYNPSGHSYLHWVAEGSGWFWLKLLVGTVLGTVLLMLWRTTSGVLRRSGIILVILFCLGAGMTWSRLTGLPVLGAEALLVWALLSLAALFTAGLSYSHLDHRLGGITHTEEVK